jgi:hypothetical protein
MNGMAASAKQLEKHLLFWDKYKHLWEVGAWTSPPPHLLSSPLLHIHPLSQECMV